ncbi:cytidine deaminase-like protein [Xylariomycetidae sp. FL0641]|nr:cytidine deaminase-like protein [Xylariomycetidae sp. FL0641]
MIAPTELPHLRRSLALAAEALAAGDAPFGSVLAVDGGGGGGGAARHEERNRTRTAGDATAHPELALARWAARHLTAAERAAATVYTSGEHCPMCAAAHAWAGLGRVVYVASAAQLQGWLREWGVLGEEDAAVACLPVRAVAPRVRVEGPVPELEGEIRELHRRSRGVA